MKDSASHAGDGPTGGEQGRGSGTSPHTPSLAMSHHAQFRLLPRGAALVAAIALVDLSAGAVVAEPVVEAGAAARSQPPKGSSRQGTSGRKARQQLAPPAIERARPSTKRDASPSRLGPAAKRRHDDRPVTFAPVALAPALPECVDITLPGVPATDTAEVEVPLAPAVHAFARTAHRFEDTAGETAGVPLAERPEQNGQAEGTQKTGDRPATLAAGSTEPVKSAETSVRDAALVAPFALPVATKSFAGGDSADAAHAVAEPLAVPGVRETAAKLEYRQALGGPEIRLGSLVETLSAHYPDSELAQLPAGPIFDSYVSLDQLGDAGIPIAFDPVEEQFTLSAPVAGAPQTTAAAGPVRSDDGNALMQQSPSFASATANLSQDVGLPSAIPREQEIQLPVILDGNYRGDVDIVVGSDNQLRVRLASLLSALQRVLRPEVAERLRALPAVDGLVPASALAPAIRLRIDETAIEIVADVPPDSRPQGDVSLAEDRPDNLQYTEPQNFAAAVAIDFGGAYAFSGPGGFSGQAGRVAAWANVGGVDGVFVDAEAFYDSGDRSSFRRGDIRLSMDDPERAIRYSLGDILYQTRGFQGAPRIGGISAQRLYEELDPLRIIRPQGRTSFTLDRSATVEVILNGIPFRTVRFDPGTYSINDIPFAEGGNNVELLIRDDSGAERRLEFSGYSSANLLAEGVAEFGIVAGFTSQFTPGGIRYDTSDPVASGFYRMGIASNLTLGANAQASRRLGQIGGELIYSRPAILFSARGAISHLDNRGTGYTWEVNAQFRPLRSGSVSGLFLEGNARATSRDFASLGITDPRNDFRLETSVRGGFGIGESSNISLGYSRQFGRDDVSDISRYSVTASRRFGKLAAFLTYDRRGVERGTTENRVLFTVSVPLGSRSTYARAAYDSERQAFRAEVQRLPRGAAGDLSGSIAVETNERGQEILGQLRYRHNRFIAGIDNTIVYSDASGGISTAVSRYSVRTGLGFTAGRVLVSPTLGEGSFVAVAAGEGISEGQIVLNDSPIGPQAHSDGLGPAVFGGIRGYVPTRITADVVTDQAGFESASETINILPGARTGYLVTVGEEATAIVVATVRRADGTPVTLLAGTIARIDGSGPSVETFTNRAGRLVAESLAAGTYRLEIPGTGTAIFTLTQDQVGIVQLGELILQPPGNPENVQ